MIVLLAVFGLSGVALADQASAEAAIAEAKAAFDKANKTGFAWTTTETYLKDAEKAAAAGDYAKAEELAKEATATANASMKQSEEQANAGPM